MTDREKFEAWFKDYTGVGVEEHPSSNIIELVWKGWQAALASQQPADDGWIEWAGGECPVGKDVLTEIRLRSGGHGTGEGEYFAWSQDGHEYDIIAYRVVKP